MLSQFPGGSKFWNTHMGRDFSKLGNDVGNFLDRFGNGIGLGGSVLEPAFTIDPATASKFTKGATNIAKTISRGLVGLNVVLTLTTLAYEWKNDKLNVHSIINLGVSAVTVGLGIAGAALGAPVLVAGGAILGVVYGIAVVGGFDDWVDSKIGW
jgi:hypothetical protein